MDPSELYIDVTREIASKKIRVIDNDNDPYADAIILHDKVLGKGGQRLVYEGKLDIERLSKEGCKEMIIPLVTHEKLNGKCTMADWGAKNAIAREEIDKLRTKEALESRLKDAFREQGILNRDNTVDVAVGISTLPLAINVRDMALKYVLGMRGDNIVYHICQGEAKRNLAYNVMELMDGVLSPANTVGNSPSYHLHVLKNVVRGLNRFKQVGIVHRDIKPDNIFYRGNHGRPEIKIADFGIMKLLDISMDYKTKTGSCIGTPYFMCPEQPQDSRNLTWQGDQFSAGAGMYTLLSGYSPLGLPNEQVETMEPFIVMCHVVDQTKKKQSFMGKKNKQLEGIERILAKMMQKQKSDRYPNYEEILEDIKLVEKKKLPKHADPTLVSTVFEQGKYSNHYNNLYRNWRAVGIGAAAAFILGAGVYLTGASDKITESMKKLYHQVVSK